MSQSLCKIYLHIIFHIKTNSPQIDDEHTFHDEYIQFLKLYRVDYDERTILLTNLLPLQGEVCAMHVPGAMPRAMCLLAFQAAITSRDGNISVVRVVIMLRDGNIWPFGPL